MKQRCRFLLLLPVLVGLSGCAGPRPVVTQQALRAPQSAGAPYLLTVTVANQGWGEGEIELVARLRSRASSQTVAQTSQELDLQPHETVSVVIPLQPDAPGDYVATVEARYPPM